MDISGPPPLTPPTIATPSVSTSILLAPTPHTATPATTVSPFTHFRGFPIYFVRSGFINFSTGSARYSGTSYYSHSRTPTPADYSNAFALLFDSTSTFPSHTSYRLRGISLQVSISPLYFVRSGYIVIPYGSLRRASSHNYL